MLLEDQIYRWLGWYMQLPQWAKACVGGAYRMFPAAFRHGSEYERFSRESAIVASEEIERLAREKLAATLAHALNSVPAYRNFGIDSGNDLDPEEWLARFPVVSKADIKTRLQTFLARGQAASQLLPMHTGGSTSEPMRFFLHKGKTRPREAAYISAFQSAVGGVGSDIVLSLRGRSVVGAERGGPIWMWEPIKNQLILSSDHLEPRWMPQYVEAIRRFKPRIIEAFPSALYPLARWLKDHPLPEFTDHVRGVLLYSENVFDHQIEAFRSIFPCPVLKHYGHSERVLMASSRPDDDRYFFWPLYGHLELLDAAGRPVTREGEIGEIVGTSFDNFVMPFIRYRTGDFAVRGAIGSADPFRVCNSIEGRMQEFVVCRDRRLISITTLGAAHFASIASARAIQFEQFTPGELILKLLIDSPLTKEMQHEIEHAIREKTQGGCEVQVARVDEIPRTASRKQLIIRQHLDISGFFAGSMQRSVESSPVEGRP